jgi:hypothetical protein
MAHVTQGEQNQMIRTKQIYGVIAVGLGAALTLTACGSSSSKASSPSSAAGSASVSAGSSTISAKIMVAGDITSTIPFTVPEIVPTVKGVLRGFPNVQIETCDTKGTASASIACEEKAISDKVAAVVYGFGYLPQNQALLAKAGIPLVGDADTTSSVSFATASAQASYIAVGIALGKAGCTKLGTVYLDGTDVLADYIKKGIMSLGGTEVARAAVAANAADLSPAISKLTGAGANCIAVSTTPTGAAQALTAIKQSGKKEIVGGASAVFSQQLLNSLGAGLTNGLIVADEQLNAADDQPGIAQIKADIASQSSTAPVTEIGIFAWIGARLIAAALPKIQGPVTASSMLAALNGLRDVDMDGVIHSWSSIELSNPAFKRLFNPYGISYTMNDLKATKNGDFFDLNASGALS